MRKLRLLMPTSRAPAATARRSFVFVVGLGENVERVRAGLVDRLAQRLVVHARDDQQHAIARRRRPIARPGSAST